jgi:hypothetical protein
MGFKVGNVEYADPHDCLRHVLRMVRVPGGTENDGLTDVSQRIANATRRLRDEIRKHPGLFDEVERLRLVTLEAEAYQFKGDFHAAVSTLEPVWMELKPKLDAWSKQNLLEPTENAALLRQKIWAVLQYVFFGIHGLEGNQKRALQYFRRVEEIIRGELQSDQRIPHGTLALCQYFIGICYNVTSFADAERHLLDAQKNTYARVSRELSRAGITESEKRYELAHKDVFGARILSGLARVAFHQGHLLRAEHLLYAAQNLLLGTQQESLKRFLASLLWTVKRRRAAWTMPEYEEAMTGLADCFGWYKQARDATGQFRTASELARGYLDFAEFDGREPVADLREAERWLKRIPTHAPYPAEHVRKLLLDSRLCLLRGNVDLAERPFTDAQDAAKGKLRRECWIEVSLMDATFHLHETPPDLRSAARIIDKALTAIRLAANDDPQAEARPDPVSEAECYLLLAKVELLRGNPDTAQVHLRQWGTVSQFIDNYYLHHIGKTLQSKIFEKSPVFSRVFDGYDPVTKVVSTTIPVYLKEYEAWLRSVIGSRYGITKKVDWAKFYGKNPSNIDRRSKTDASG